VEPEGVCCDEPTYFEVMPVKHARVHLKSPSNLPQTRNFPRSNPKTSK